MYTRVGRDPSSFWVCLHSTCFTIMEFVQPQAPSASLHSAQRGPSSRQAMIRFSKHPSSTMSPGASHQVVEHAEHRENFSELCINREKLIYQALPKHPNILECLTITERGVQFPYPKFGSLRDYLQNNQATMHTRQQWIKNAIDAVALIHSYGVIHAISVHAISSWLTTCLSNLATLGH